MLPAYPNKGREKEHPTPRQVVASCLGGWADTKKRFNGLHRRTPYSTLGRTQNAQAKERVGDRPAQVRKSPIHYSCSIFDEFDQNAIRSWHGRFGVVSLEERCLCTGRLESGRFSVRLGLASFSFRDNQSTVGFTIQNIESITLEQCIFNQYFCCTHLTIFKTTVNVDVMFGTSPKYCLQNYFQLCLPGMVP